MTLVARLRAVRYRNDVASRREAHDGAPSDAAAREIQLRRLNTEWARLTEASPYVARLQRERRLPRRFDTLEQFVESVPSMSRADVQEHGDMMRCRGPEPDFFRTTGGSTAQPVQLPAWSGEIAATRPDVWLGRSWYGVTPASSLFLLWGHSHLLGTGVSGRVRAWKMRMSDRLLGYTRFSAYDLRPERLRAAADVIARRRPEYVVGYSVALDLFARTNEDRTEQLRAVGLKAVVGTSESFPSDDSAARLEALFGCPVAMEYGAVETGLLAHTRPPGGFDVFWNTYLVDAEPSGAGHRLFVTSLFPRCFPLLRYDIGDEATLPTGLTGPAVGVRRFERVLGRCNDYVTLESGALVHSELFTHAVRSCHEVHGYQIVQAGSRLTVRYVAPGPLSPAAAEGVRERLARIHPSLRAVALERVERLGQTVAGKTRMIVRE